jgi:glyoxylase-like metal-dependent hydrolase (beta-lactamase superfamily II)
MNFEQIELKPSSIVGSGRVVRWKVPDTKIHVNKITTFCPDIVGPGPVHTYLISGEALILVDPGIPTNLAKGLFYYWRNQPIPPEIEQLPSNYSAVELVEGIELAGYSPKDIDLVVISHGHPDHFFMTNEIVQRGNAKILAHILDTPDICNPWGMLAIWVSRQQQMKATGMPPSASLPHNFTPEIISAFDLERVGICPRVDAPIVKDGPLTANSGSVTDVAAVHLPGHSPGSIGLLVGPPDSERVLLCGDVLLNPITPHPEDLLVYLQTLQELGRTERVGLVLPAHGDMILDLSERASFLKKHHEMRLKTTYELCQNPKSVWDIAAQPDYFDTYVDPTRFNFLAGLEAMVHVELLHMVGALQRTSIRGPVHYFVAGREPFQEVWARITHLVSDREKRSFIRY